MFTIVIENVINKYVSVWFQYVHVSSFWMNSFTSANSCEKKKKIKTKN